MILQPFELEDFSMRFRQNDLSSLAKLQGGRQPSQSALWVVQTGKLRHGAPHNSLTVSTPREMPETGKVSRLPSSRVLSLSLLACHAALPQGVWGTSLPQQGTPGECVGVHTHAHTDPRAHSHTQSSVHPLQPLG